ncbi:ThuA domain-containing protein [Silvibacterium sp.]|uniref:ThuA domain-containing protein n=1 Tax=Silvibacterium sp. TaxID=1964179 RepID=UPI0039E5832A
MKRFLLAVIALWVALPAWAQQPTFRVLAFYSDTAERDHVDFARDAIRFYSDLAEREHFSFTATTHWEDCTAENLAQYRVVLWLNDLPHTAEQRTAFEQYMAHGGGWLGFHAAGYNDESTQWPWFVDFLGGAVFYGNSWPPLPATLTLDDPAHPGVRGLPASFVSPPNEWYIWKPSPRRNKNVHVLLTLSPSNYPLGLKDVIYGGDLPVVWTNTRYRMIYMNMGHGDRIFTDPTQNQLFANSLLWLSRPKK